MIVDFDQIYNKAIKPAIQECMPQAEQILRNEQAQWGQLIGETKPVEPPSSKSTPN